MPLKNQNNAGFTLIELLITMVLIAVVAAFAVPAFDTMSANNRMSANANRLVGALNLARAEAVKRSRIIRIDPTDGSNWGEGVTVWQDEDGDSTIDDAEIIRLVVFDGGDFSVSPLDGGGSSVSQLVFTGGGLADQNYSVQLCDSRTGEQGRLVTITTGGRVRAGVLSCS